MCLHLLHIPLYELIIFCDERLAFEMTAFQIYYKFNIFLVPLPSPF